MPVSRDRKESPPGEGADGAVRVNLLRILEIEDRLFGGRPEITVDDQPGGGDEVQLELNALDMDSCGSLRENRAREGPDARNKLPRRGGGVAPLAQNHRPKMGPDSAVLVVTTSSPPTPERRPSGVAKPFGTKRI
jgi:hypothetical protein